MVVVGWVDLIEIKVDQFLVGLCKLSLIELNQFTGEISGRKRVGLVVAGCMEFTARREPNITVL